MIALILRSPRRRSAVAAADGIDVAIEHRAACSSIAAPGRHELTMASLNSEQLTGDECPLLILLQATVDDVDDDG